MRNVYVKSVLVWQNRVVGNALTTDAEVSVYLGDIYVLSTWLAALILRLRRKKVVFWGHGLYGNEKSILTMLRVRFLRMAHVNLVYGERAVKLLIETGVPKERVQAVYNSLDYERQESLRNSAVDEQFYASLGVFESPELSVLVFIGRLTAQKKLDLLIQVVKELNREGGRFNLVLIGDGPERQTLETLAADAKDYVFFAGPRYEKKLPSSLLTRICVFHPVK